MMHPSDPPEVLRVGIIGAGGIARFHAQALRKLADVRLVAVCDRDENRARALQAAFGVRNAFGSVDEMARKTTLDAVHVLLPPAAHAAVTIDALEKGWHVFAEKPFATSVQECRQIEAAVALGGPRIGVNHNLTFLPAFLHLISDVRARRLGRLESVHVGFNVPMPQLATGQHGHWMFAEPGNIVLELGPHPLSTVVRLLGPVRAASTVVSGKRTLRNGSTFFDSWHSTLTCERGIALCSIEVGGGFPDGWVYVTGQDASAMVDLMRNTYTFSTKTRFMKPIEDFRNALGQSRSLLAYGCRNLWNFGAGVLGLKVAHDVFSVGMRNSVAAFYDAVGRGAEPPVGLAEATAVIEGCHAVIDAAQTQYVQN